MSMNVMTIDGHQAVIVFDPEIELFRGEFIGLSGGADFYARDIEGLKQEGAISLRVYLDDCKEKGREPYRKYSGKFNLRIRPELHERITLRARAENKSINMLVNDILEQAT